MYSQPSSRWIWWMCQKNKQNSVSWIYSHVLIRFKLHFRKSLTMMMIIFAPCHIFGNTTKVAKKEAETEWDCHSTRKRTKKNRDLLCTALLCVENLLYLCIHFNWNHWKMLFRKLKYNVSFVYILLEIYVN